MVEGRKFLSIAIAGGGLAAVGAMLLYYGFTFQPWDVRPEMLEEIGYRWRIASIILFASIFLVLPIVRLANIERILPPPPAAFLRALVHVALLSFFLIAFGSLSESQRSKKAKVDSGEMKLYLDSSGVSVGQEDFEENCKRSIRRTVAFAMFYSSVVLLSLSTSGKRRPKTRPKTGQSAVSSGS